MSSIATLLKCLSSFRRKDWIETRDKNGEFAAGLTIDAREESTDHHAHMRIVFPSEGEGKVDVSFHNTPTKVEGERRPPYVEDCIPWLSTYLKIDKVQARKSASYEFNESFKPVIVLPFPLMTGEKSLAGSLVTGVSLFLNKQPPEMAIVQNADDETFVSLSGRSETSLKEFDLSTELERFSTSINSLMKRQEATNASDSRKDRE
jgi:hypothetical protein